MSQSQNSVKKLYELNQQNTYRGRLVLEVEKNLQYILISKYESNQIKMFSRQGDLIHTIDLPQREQIIDLSIDSKQQYLSILTKQQSFIYLIKNMTSEFMIVEAEQGTFTKQIWSQNQQILLIGTSKGGMVVYNIYSGKKQTLMGKQSKKITHLCVNNNQLIATFSDDQILQISKLNGEPVNEYEDQIQQQQYQGVEDLFWINESLFGAGKATLVIIHGQGKEVSLIQESAFFNITVKTNYGKILSIVAPNANQLVICTIRGYILTYCFNEDQQLSQQSQNKLFNNNFDNCHYDQRQQKLICFGDNQMKVVELNNIEKDKNVKIQFQKNYGQILKVFVDSLCKNVIVCSNNNTISHFVMMSGGQSVYNENYIIQQQNFNELKVRVIQNINQIGGVETAPFNQQYNLALQNQEINEFALIRSQALIACKNLLLFYDLGPSVAQFRTQIEFSNVIEKILTNEQNLVVVSTGQEIFLINKNKPQQKTVLKNIQCDIFKLNSYFIQNFIIGVYDNNVAIYDTDSQEYSVKVAPNFIIDQFYFDQHNFIFFLHSQVDKSIYYIEDINQADVIGKIDLNNIDYVNNFLVDAAGGNTYYVQTGNQILTLIKPKKRYDIQEPIKVLKEALSVEDIENDQNSETQLTIIENDITPIFIYQGFLICSDNSCNVYSSFLSSHSFKSGQTTRITDPLGKTINFQDAGSEIFDKSKTYLTCPHQSKFNQQEDNIPDIEKEYYLKSFIQNIQLQNFDVAYKSNLILNSPQLWQHLALVALKYKNLNVAILSYQRLGHVSMAYYISHIRDQQLDDLSLGAEIAIILCDYQNALKIYERMKQHLKMFQLLINIHDFQTAHDIALKHGYFEHQQLASLYIGEQLYRNDELIKATQLFEKLLIDLKEHQNVKKGNDNAIQQILQQTLYNLAKIHIKQGSLIKAQEYCNQIREDAEEDILDLANLSFQQSQYPLSYVLYKRVQSFEKTVQANLRMKQHQQIQFVNQANTTSSSLKQDVQTYGDYLQDKTLILQLAEYFVKSDPSLAERLYKKSGNIQEYIKFLLYQKNDHVKAEEVLEMQESFSKQTANTLAEYFNQSLLEISNRKKKAIYYFLKSGQKILALKMAIESEEVDSYCQYVDKVGASEALTLARYLVSKGNFKMAGKYYSQCQQLEKTIYCYIKAQMYEEAINVVVQQNDGDLFELLVNIFAGEVNLSDEHQLLIKDEQMEKNYTGNFIGNEYYQKINQIIQHELGLRQQKKESLEETVDPFYLFLLYLRSDKVAQANTIALTILDKELQDGSFKSAQQQSARLVTHLRKAKKKVHTELFNKDVVLQSYNLVKKALSRGHHLLASLLLNRISNYVHFFEKNSVDLMTSTVIESSIAGLKYLAYNWALNLCKPQYRNQINIKYKDKIEKIALKQVNPKEMDGRNFANVSWSENNSLAVLRCPNCNIIINNAFNINCSKCSFNFVICAASGKAILENQSLLQCSFCLSIAFQQELEQLLQIDNSCPYCASPNTSDSIFTSFCFDNIKNIMKF